MIRKPTINRLLKDQSGNTLMLVAGMFLPLLAMVGSGIDMSRAYLTKGRLQAACDAGVLAARKVQIGSKITTESEAAAARYFSANFGKAAFGSRNIDFDVWAHDSKTVAGIAKAKLDSSVMAVFGVGEFNLTAECNAVRDVSDTDIMFVLDTTGSMLDTNSGDSDNRFVTMKNAVSDFYVSLTSGISDDVTLRLGFVPYAEMVNVGGLLPKDMMVDRWTYQSRIADGVTVELGTDSYTSNWRRVGGGSESTTTSTFARTSTWVPATGGTEFNGGSPGYWNYTCNTPGGSLNIYDKSLLSTRTEPFAGPPVGTRTIETYRETWNGVNNSSSYNGSECVLTSTTYDNTVFEFDWITEPDEDTDHYWLYKPVEYDVSSLISGGVGSTMTVKIGKDHSDRTVTWAGCIEERDTVRASEFSPMPVGAHDLDIDSKPSSQATKWRPAMPELIFTRYDVAEERITGNHNNLADIGGGPNNLCPSAAKKLSPMTKGDLDTYLSSLVAKGATHHDIGMLWGARLISPSGIFSAENSGKQSRHILFMTDGKIESNVERQDSYGFARLDRRRHPGSGAPISDDQNLLIEKRFLAICEAARARGITIWSIAFGTGLTDAMKTCSGNDKAFEAANAGELDLAFKSIAGGIAKLRLTK